MALALRPAVALIALASILFLLAGALATLHEAPDYAAIESYAFGLVNLAVAVLIARGNERMLGLRMGFAAFFVVERPLTTLLFPAPADSVAVHLGTAVVEAVIFVSTLRVWRLGHSVGAAELAMLSLPADPKAADGLPGAPGEAPDR